MKKNNLYIFTEGGDGIGFGHITRCSALYEKALEQNLNPKFIVFGKNIEETLKQYNHEIREWKDIDYLSTLITKEDFVIVDSYLASIEIYQKISNLSKKSLYIDDNMRLDYPSGIVVNPSLYGDQLNYPLKKDIKYLLGKDYIILRKEFENIEKKEKNKDKEIRKILITLGGTDIKNLTPKILKILKNINSEYQIRVVIGRSFDNINEILLEKTSNIELLYNLTAFQMLNEMKNSDLVISACGQTIYELLVAGTVFIPIVVIENQINNAIGLEKLGIFDKVLRAEDIEEKKFDITKVSKNMFILKVNINKIISILKGEIND